MIWSLQALMQHAGQTTKFIGGKWVPARPEPGPFWGRLQAAWAVLRGRADAFVWPDQNGGAA